MTVEQLGTVDVADDRRGVVVHPSTSLAEVRALLRSDGLKLRPRRRGTGLILDWSDARSLLHADVSDRFSFTDAARRFLQNRRHVQERASAVEQRVRRLQESGVTGARQMLTDVASRVQKLDDHQLINVAVMTQPESWGACVFDEQGTGKTVTAMAAFDVLFERGEINLMVVVAPKSMIREWAAEFERFYGDLYHVTVVDGTRAERVHALHSGADVVVANYESLVSLAQDFRLLVRGRDVALAVDESFFVKNPEARRTAAVAELREWCERAWVLCGTPAPNHPSDLVAQFDLVDFGVTFDGVSVDEDRDAARAQVASVIERRGVWTRSRKEEVLDLPERTFRSMRLQMSPAQEAAYSSALDDLVLDLRRTTDRDFSRRLTSFLQRRAALLRIASNPAPVVPGYNETPCKVDALDELIPNLMGRGEKVVLWSFYRANLDVLAGRYEEHGLVRVDGSITSLDDRREAVRRFQEDDATRIFLGNPAAAGAGLTLHSGRIAIYESMSNQAAHYLQSLDRIHRRGQGRPVEYITLLSGGTIEESEYDRLLSKADAQADLLGDERLQRPTRSTMLEELLASQRSLGQAD